MEPEGPARVERRLAAVLAADVRRLASGRGVNGDTDRERLTTRPGGSHRLPLTSGLRPIPAVRMPTGQGIKSTHSRPSAFALGMGLHAPETDLHRRTQDGRLGGERTCGIENRRRRQLSIVARMVDLPPAIARASSLASSLAIA
jgi:hypothetical protein